MERFGEVGDAFDPNIHEAVLQQPTDEVAEDYVSMVLRYGYRVNDRVVRYRSGGCGCRTVKWPAKHWLNNPTTGGALLVGSTRP